MNVADSLGDLTGQLAHLYAARAPSTRDGLDVDAALHGRAAVVGLCRELLFWGTGLRQGVAPTYASMEVNPTRALVWQLTRHPMPEAQRSPIDVAHAAPTGSAAQRWEHVATSATLTQTQWGAASDKPTGQQVQTVLADVAALALAVSHLDSRLAASATASGRPDVAASLTGEAVHGLRHSAESTLRHLARGELPAWRATAAPLRPRLEVLPVRHPGDVPRGLSRLMSLLDAGTQVSPEHLRHVLRGQDRVAGILGRHCAALWQATGDPSAFDAGRRLHELRTWLTGAADVLRRDVGSLDPSDPRPVLQVSECLRGLGFSHPPGVNGLQERIDLVSHQAASLLYSVEAVGTCARTQVEHHGWIAGRWSEDQSDRTWSTVTHLDHLRVAPLLTLSETALDLLTRPAALAATPVGQPSMASSERRWHALA